MKIGIISELNKKTVNYGNHLQAYALNKFLCDRYDTECVQSIMLTEKQPWKRTKYLSMEFVKQITDGIIRRLNLAGSKYSQSQRSLDPRRAKFEEFRNRWFRDAIPIMSVEDLCKANYDAIIVGSDIVWIQFPVKINRAKFLDFTANKPFKRISYAASFGSDYIPKENVRHLRKYLRRFDAISVREHSSVAMLKEIGIPNASYCLDPTLLLSAAQWEQIEQPPSEIEDGEGYIFLYLLGKDVQQRENVMAFAKTAGLKVVYIPNALGVRVEADDALEGTQIEDCSIENWIWLIHHARYVIIDSFHGAVFSTIFKKQFAVLKRYTSIGYDINNRMQDYLREIGQTDKYISGDQLQNLADLEWDYQKIDAELELRQKNSVAFLDRAIGEING